MKRLVRFYMDQDYRGRSLLFIYNNSPVKQELNVDAIKLTGNKAIILLNNSLDLRTRKTYKDVGSIHRDALEMASQSCTPEVVTFFEDDNYYLPDHLSQGMKGMFKAYSKDYLAYKPYQSFFNCDTGIALQSDTFEPSFFVDYDFIKEHGFSKTSVSFHYKWIERLLGAGKLFIDVKGKPTLIYNWGDNNLSGQRNDGQAAILNHRAQNKDTGNGIIEPISKEEAKKIYRIVPHRTLFEKIKKYFYDLYILQL